MVNILIRIPYFFLQDKSDLNFYCIDELDPEKFIISFKKSENEDEQEKSSIFFEFRNKKMKNGIIRYLLFMDILRPLCGYYEHNYDYIYDINPKDGEHMYQLQSIYVNKFFFFGSRIKLKNIINEIMYYLPYCNHFIHELNKLSVFDRFNYYIINKKCTTCMKNKSVKSVYNVNKYLFFLYDIFSSEFNCPFEITDIILEYIKPIDLISQDLSIFT